MRLTLHYKRVNNVVDGEYVYSGRFELDGTSLEDFIGYKYQKIVGQLHNHLVGADAHTRVFLQRTERPGLSPTELGENLIQLLRTDPLTAYRTMTQPLQSCAETPDTKDFGRQVYIRVSMGKIEDPITGEWRTLAYGRTSGWKIRGEGNSSESWIALNTLVDNAPEGGSSIERIAYANWALVDVAELLRQPANKFYLPRPWNTNGPWISRQELTDRYMKEKSKCQ